MAAIIGPARWTTSSPSSRAADVDLSDDLLDRIDAIVPPGVNLNPADAGYDNPALRPRPECLRDGATAAWPRWAAFAQ